MRPLQAEISQDIVPQTRRGAVRRTLRLVVSASASQSGWTTASINDLSEAGLKIETAARLAADEVIVVDLPIMGSVEARVAWSQGSTFGCEFLSPISKAVVSAALLQGFAETSMPDVEPLIEELPVGKSPSIKEIMIWKSEFDQSKGARGYQLLGFRQTPEGHIVALVTRTN